MLIMKLQHQTMNNNVYLLIQTTDLKLKNIAIKNFLIFIKNFVKFVDKLQKMMYY